MLPLAVDAGGEVPSELRLAAARLLLLLFFGTPSFPRARLRFCDGDERKSARVVRASEAEGRTLITPVLRFAGRSTPWRLRKRPQALQSGRPSASRRQRGVFCKCREASQLKISK